MKLRCPRCQQKLSVPDKFAGKAIRCAACNQAFTVPQAKVAVSGPGVDIGFDLESLAKVERATGQLQEEELATYEAEEAERKRAGASKAGVRTCPNCGKQTPVKDMHVEVLCSHCWKGIPALSTGDGYDVGEAKLVGYKGAIKTSVGFYDGLTTSFAYPFGATGSLLIAVLVAIAVVLVPVGLMTAIATALQYEDVGKVEGVQQADLSSVQIILRVIFGVVVLYFSAMGVHAFLDVIRTTSVGSEQPPGLTWNPSQWGKSLVAYVALLVYYAVMTYIVLFFAESSTDVIPVTLEDLQTKLTNPSVITGLIIVSAIVPMNLIGLSLGSVGQGLNPVNVIKSIIHTHFHYLFLLVLVCVFGAMSLAALVAILTWFIPMADKMVSGSASGNIVEVFMGLLAWGAVMGFVFVAVYMLGRIHGLFARSFRNKLAFGEV